MWRYDGDYDDLSRILLKCKFRRLICSKSLCDYINRNLLFRKIKYVGIGASVHVQVDDVPYEFPLWGSRGHLSVPPATIQRLGMLKSEIASHSGPWTGSLPGKTCSTKG